MENKPKKRKPIVLPPITSLIPPITSLIPRRPRLSISEIDPPFEDTEQATADPWDMDPMDWGDKS